MFCQLNRHPGNWLESLSPCPLFEFEGSGGFEGGAKYPNRQTEGRPGRSVGGEGPLQEDSHGKWAFGEI